MLAYFQSAIFMSFNIAAIHEFQYHHSYLEAEWRNLRKDSSYDIPFSRTIWKRLSRNINGEKVEVRGLEFQLQTSSSFFNVMTLQQLLFLSFLLCALCYFLFSLQVPRQCNDYDCGLFMLYYIEKFIQQAPESLTKESLGMVQTGQLHYFS